MLINYRAPALADGQPSLSPRTRRASCSHPRINCCEQKPTVDPAVFKDKIVFIGLTASGLVDVFQTPFGRSRCRASSCTRASPTASCPNRFIRPASDAHARDRRLRRRGAGRAHGRAPAVLRRGRRRRWRCRAWTWSRAQRFQDGLWLNHGRSRSSAMAVALFAGTAYRYFVEGREKRKVKRLFGRYVSKDVYQQLLDNPELARARRAAPRHDGPVLGYPRFHERLPRREIRRSWSRSSTSTSHGWSTIVFRHQGTVDKFVGDMVMALFGAPARRPGPCRARGRPPRWTWSGSSGELNRKWVGEGRRTLDIGIGINSGDMIAGNIGSSSIMSYTVIGDNVNLGSRLESLNKDYRTRIIISDATRARLSGIYDIRPLGDVVVKGKTRAGRDFRDRRAVSDSGATRKPRYEDMLHSLSPLVLTAHPGVRAARRPSEERSDKAKQIGEKVKDLNMSEKDERELGEAVSARSARSSACSRTRRSPSTSPWSARSWPRPARGPT